MKKAGGGVAKTKGDVFELYTPSRFHMSKKGHEVMTEPYSCLSTAGL